MPSDKWRQLLELASRTSTRSGKSVLRQIVEILGMRRRNPTLGATDYFAFRLFDPRRSARPEDYLGWRAERQLALALNPRTAVTPAWDKFTFTLVARAFGLPVPRLVAFHRPGNRPDAGVADAITTTRDSLVEWLRTNSRWPVFAKPSFGWKSVGCRHLAGYRRDGDALLTRRGEAIPIERFVSDVVDAPSGPDYRVEMGYLFQEVLQPHPEIVRLTGSQAISGVRVVMIQDDAGVEVVASVWKIAADQNDSDQFDNSYAGNRIAEVDPHTGRVGMVFDLAGGLAEFRGRDNSAEPVVLPDWTDAMTLCKRAAAALPLLGIQHWDLALTDRGPCLLEVNDWGAIGALQCFGRGLLTDRMRALLRARGDRAVAPWIGSLCG